MNLIYSVIYVIMTFIFNPPVAPFKEVTVTITSDTIETLFPDSCTAWHCYQNIVPNVNVWNPQTNQIIVRAEFKRAE